VEKVFFFLTQERILLSEIKTTQQFPCESETLRGPVEDFVLLPLFLVAFAKLWKRFLASSRLFVCMKQLGSHWIYFL